MKQKDIAVLVVIVFFSGVVSLLISNKLITNPKNRQQQVEVVEKISTNFTPPNEKYINTTSINPTQLISIGDSNNPTPFNKAQ